MGKFAAMLKALPRAPRLLSIVTGNGLGESAGHAHGYIPGLCMQSSVTHVLKSKPLSYRGLITAAVYLGQDLAEI
jgi:hypothetical protein